MRKLLLVILFLCFSGMVHSAEKYELASCASLLKHAGCLAKHEAGQEEVIGGNKDQFIKKYLRSVGINVPAPYCAAGLYWAFDSASSIVGCKNPLKKTAVATAQYNHFKANGTKTDYKPEVFDLLVWQRGNSWSGHIEIIIEVGEMGWVTTIGFNTGSTNPREGDGVYIKKRHIANPIGVLIIKGLAGFDT